MLLLHGIEDQTVPFTATAEAARILRSCGVTHCSEVYVACADHQDPIMHLMLGGRARTAIMKWITAINASRYTSYPEAIAENRVLLVRSKI